MISYARLANGTKQSKEDEVEMAVPTVPILQTLTTMLAGTAAIRIAVLANARSQRTRLALIKRRRNGKRRERIITTEVARKAEEIPGRIIALARRAMLNIRERLGNLAVLP